MGVDFKSLRDSDPSTLDVVVSQWREAKGKLIDASVTASSVTSRMEMGSWQGDAAAAAVSAAERYSGQVHAGTTEAEAIRGIISDAQELFTEAKDKLDDAIAEVDEDPNLKIDDNGDISVELDDSYSHMPVEAKDQVLTEKESKADDLEVKVEEAVAQAQLVDIKTSDALWGAAGYSEDDAADTFQSDAGNHALDAAGINNLISEMERHGDEPANNEVLFGYEELTDEEYEYWNDLTLRQKLDVAEGTAVAGALALFGAENDPDADKPHNNRHDAYRHAMWNSKLVMALGSEGAEEFANAHETNPPSPRGGDGNPANETLMDLHNNEVGREVPSETRIPLGNPFGREINERLDNGELIVIDDDGNLVRSS